MKLRSWRVKLIPAAKGRFAEHCDVFATNSGGREIQYAASRHPRHIVSTVTKCARRRLAQPPIGPASLEGSSRASRHLRPQCICGPVARPVRPTVPSRRSEEHTSELQSLMRISYAVFCLTKKHEETTYE